MTRKEYIRELVERLGNMAEVDRMEAIRYYQEYFDEAGPRCEEEVINSLGTPAQVAKQILADYAVRETVMSPTSPKKSMNAIWWIIIAIVASPVAFPVGVSIVGLLIGLVGAVGGLLIAGVATIFALGVSGFAILAQGAFVGFSTPAIGAVYLGIAMMLIGVALLILVGLYLLMTKYFPLVIEKIYGFIKRLMRKGEKA